MSLDTYANFQAAIADQLGRTDLTSQIVDCITLFEAEATFELFRERLQEKIAILVPKANPSISISNAANNGSGLIRLTVSDSSSFTTNDLAVVNGVQGTTEADGEWVVTVINGTTIDLQGSTFTNAYTTGGTIQEFGGQASLPSDYLSWRRVTWAGSPRIDLDYVHPSLFQAMYPHTPTGSPQKFTIEGSTLKVMPTSGQTLEFDYYAKTLALSGNLNWLFTNHVDCYWNGVLQQVYSYIHDYDQASIYEQKKQQNFDQIKKYRFRDRGHLSVKVFGLTP